jgi:hypothetical protein
VDTGIGIRNPGYLTCSQPYSGVDLQHVAILYFGWTLASGCGCEVDVVSLVIGLMRHPELSSWGNHRRGWVAGAVASKEGRYAIHSACDLGR